MDLLELEKALASMVATRLATDDPAHDLWHCKRVTAMAKRLCNAEGGRAEIVIPAAWLHDCVTLPKNHPRRAQASTESAAVATEWLAGIGYPAADLPAVAHAIAAHSFSAGIEPRTVEAAIVQDADRLDALGAIGIARCFATAGMLRRPFYCEQDPFCAQRVPDDRHFTVDHFFVKLLKIPATLRTASGRAEGERRTAVMKNFLAALQDEVRAGEMRSG